MPLLGLGGNESQFMGAAVCHFAQGMHAALDAGTHACPLHEVDGALEQVGRGAPGVALERLLHDLLQNLAQTHEPVLALHALIVGQRAQFAVQCLGRSRRQLPFVVHSSSSLPLQTVYDSAGSLLCQHPPEPSQPDRSLM